MPGLFRRPDRRGQPPTGLLLRQLTLPGTRTAAIILTGLLIGVGVSRAAYEGGGTFVLVLTSFRPAIVAACSEFGERWRLAVRPWPTTTGMQLIATGLAGVDLYGSIPLALASLTVWAVPPYLVLLLLLQHREW